MHFRSCFHSLPYSCKPRRAMHAKGSHPQRNMAQTWSPPDFFHLVSYFLLISIFLPIFSWQHSFWHPFSSVPPGKKLQIDPSNLKGHRSWGRLFLVLLLSVILWSPVFYSINHYISILVYTQSFCECKCIQVHVNTCYSYIHMCMERLGSSIPVWCPTFHSATWQPCFM